MDRVTKKWERVKELAGACLEAQSVDDTISNAAEGERSLLEGIRQIGEVLSDLSRLEEKETFKSAARRLSNQFAGVQDAKDTDMIHKACERAMLAADCRLLCDEIARIVATHGEEAISEYLKEHQFALLRIMREGHPPPYSDL